MNNIFAPILTNGVPFDVVYFLLLVPFIVMTATLLRHVIGFKIFSMYVFVSMTLVVGFLLRKYSVFSLGISAGVLVFIYFFSYFIKRFTNTLSLHYFSRVSMVVTMISILLLVLLSVVGRFSYLVTFLKLDKISPFAVVFGVLLSEYFSSNQTQKGFKASRKLFAYSLLFSLILGFLISWNGFESFLMRYPLFVFVFMLMTFLIGKYKGLRFTELSRFKEVERED